MKAELKKLIERCDEQGVRAVLTDDGRIDLVGHRPDDALKADLRKHKEELRGLLAERDPFRGRWSKIPTGSLPYRVDPPKLTDVKSRCLLAWVQRQEFAVHKWVMDRANSYYAKRPVWEQEQMDQAAMMDLARWQTGRDQVPVISEMADAMEAEENKQKESNDE